VATTSVLQDTSLFLRDLLITATAGLAANAADKLTQQSISLDSPVRFEEGTAPGGVKLSLYLCHIEKNEHLNNEPLLRIGNQQFLRPFYVDLHYLLTPVTKSPENNLLIMGRCIQVFSANGVISNSDLKLAREPSEGEARLRMLVYDLEAMNKLWGALAKPYRMSVVYEVAPVPVESTSPPMDGPPVAEAILDVQQMNGAS
jgi:hypothetical protein